MGEKMDAIKQIAEKNGLEYNKPVIEFDKNGIKSFVVLVKAKDFRKNSKIMPRV